MHLSCLSRRKKSLNKGVWVRAWITTFIKQVFPWLTNPRKPMTWSLVTASLNQYFTFSGYNRTNVPFLNHYQIWNIYFFWLIIIKISLAETKMIDLFSSVGGANGIQFFVINIITTYRTIDCTMIELKMGWAWGEPWVKRLRYSHRWPRGDLIFLNEF